MANLFEETQINQLHLPNRFIRSATWEGMADEQGACTPKLLAFMEELARGGVGLIISGHAYIRKEGWAHVGQLGVYQDSLLPGLTQMAETVHRAGGKIVLQLAHGGAHASRELSGLELIGPSAIDRGEALVCRATTQQDIDQVVQAFGEAAMRAEKAGFDGVQIHAAHGYLLSEFFSPFYNKRTDEYGGDLVNRARLAAEVVRSIRSAVEKDYPILIKMNSEDFLEEGLSVDEMLQIACLFQEIGINAIELSGGTPDSGMNMPVRTGTLKTPDKEVFYKEAAKRYKEKLDVPLILVGGIRSYEIAQELVESEMTDYISLSRPLIREPALINRWKAGDRRKAQCLSDNMCFKPARSGEGIYCALAEADPPTG